MRAFRLLIILLTGALLGACGGGSSGSGSGAEPPATRVFEGRAVKGVVRHGVLTVEEYAGGLWTPFFNGETDEGGLFVLDLSDATGPVRITITAGAGTWVVCDAPGGCEDVDFGADMAPPASFRITTLVPSSQRSGAVAVTPLTHLAAEWVSALPASIPVTDALIELAMDRVAQVFGVADDFARRLPLDITGDVSDATDADLVLAAMGGAFSGVAYETDLNDIQVVLDRFVREFVLLAGQLPVVADYDASRPGLDVIRNQAVSLLTLVLDDADADDVIAAINAQFSRWADHAVTEADASSDAVAAAVADAKVLLDDLDHYLTLAGIDSTAAFLATQMEQVRWLYNSPAARNHTAKMVGLVFEGAIFSLLAISQADVLPPSGACLDMGAQLPAMNLPLNYLQYCPDENTVRLKGMRYDQSVDAVIELPARPVSLDAPVRLGLRGHEGPRASIYNDMVEGEMGGELILTVSGLQDPMLLQGGASLAGTASLRPAGGNPGFDIDLDASAGFDLSALDGSGPLVEVQINDGSLVSPHGDQLRAITGPGFCDNRLPLYLSVGAQSSLQACFDFEAFSMPMMEMTLGGTLDGLFDVVSQVLAGSDSPDLASLISALDLSALAIQGNARLRISDPARGTPEYLFALDNARLDAERVGTDKTLSYHMTGLNGGYITSGSVLVATVHSDWSRLGATIRFTDGSPARSYFFGEVSDVVDDDLMQFVRQVVTELGLILGGMLGL